VKVLIAMYEKYQLLYAETDSGAILANVVYAEVGQEIWGTYSGYAGGAAIDFRYFWFDEDYNPHVNDDFLLFDTSADFSKNEVFEDLDASRAKMETIEDERLLLSQAGRDALGTVHARSDRGIGSWLSPDASEDIIYDLQDTWTLLFQF
jgi:hypothetical protein